MDLGTYFSDLHATEVELNQKYPEGVVHVTSKFHRERNSTRGATLSATCRNAARVITDGTHEEATQEEVNRFYQRQQDNLELTAKSEQLKKKQYIVVVDQHDQQTTPTVPQVLRSRSGKPKEETSDDKS